MNSKLKCLRKFLALVRPRGRKLEHWANEAVVDYLRDTTAHKKAITPKKWLEARLGRKPTSQEIKSFYYSLGFASYCLELRKIPSENGFTAFTAFTLAKESSNEYYSQCQ